MQLSKFGKKFTQKSAINQLMGDLGEAYNSNHPDLCMLGGGNPASIPGAQALFAKEMEHLIEHDLFEKMVGIYDGPQGEIRFLEVLANYLNQQFGWDISSDPMPMPVPVEEFGQEWVALIAEGAPTEEDASRALAEAGWVFVTQDCPSEVDGVAISPEVDPYLLAVGQWLIEHAEG